jgi:lauroyl/myristoyl acyltransferase
MRWWCRAGAWCGPTWSLCFPHWSEAQRRALVPKVFIHFAQAWLDRSWLWHGSADVTRQRRLRAHGRGAGVGRQ